jgi:probable F420-dependent oxidoreductase
MPDQPAASLGEGRAIRLGIGFPHQVIGTDPAQVRDFAQAAEAAGFDYLSAIEHVAGAHAERFAGVDTGFPAPPYLHDYPFHEPFTLFSFLAGVTGAIELVTSVLVLPQRQTVLVAKQAAEVALLSGGRLRLGVGVGWNHAEFESLGADFRTRGARVAEQVEVLRRLWTEPLVTFEGRWHTLDRVAIAPLPARPIPVWMGGGTGEVTLRRIARLADGWMPMARASSDVGELVVRMHGYLADAGREPSALGIQAGVGGTGQGDPAQWAAAARRWADAGATHLTLGGSPDSGVTAAQRLERAVEIKRVLGLELGL